MRPELRLLLLCARWPLESDDRRKIAALLSAEIDWSLFQRLQTRHRIRALTGWALLQVATALPGEVRVQCLADVQNGGLAELRAAAAAQQLIAALSDAGVTSRLIKGPAVSLLAFERLGLRTNRDVDILVSPCDRERAEAVIGVAGYHRVEPSADASPDVVARWIISRKDFVFVRPDGAIVELHWRLLDNSRLLRGLEAGSFDLVTSGPFTFSTLAPDDNLIYLCVHGAQHAWSRLKWLADVSAILRKSNADEIIELLAKAKRLGVYPAVGQGLLLAARHLKARLPAGMSDRLVRVPSIRLLIAVAERAMLGGGDAELEDQRFGTTLKNLSHYLIASSWRYRLEEIRFDLFDLDAAGLPPEFGRFGPFARVVGPIVLRWRRGRSAPVADVKT